MFTKKTYNFDEAAQKTEKIAQVAEKLADTPPELRPNAKFQYHINTDDGRIDLPEVSHAIGSEKGQKNILRSTLRQSVQKYLSGVSHSLATTVDGTVESAKQIKEASVELSKAFGSFFKNVGTLVTKMAAASTLASVYGIGKGANMAVSGMAMGGALVAQATNKCFEKCLDYGDRVGRSFRAAQEELKKSSLRFDPADSFLISMNKDAFDKCPDIFKEKAQFFNDGNIAIIKKEDLSKLPLLSNKDTTNVFEHKFFSSLSDVVSQTPLTNMQVKDLQLTNQRNVERSQGLALEHKGRGR